MNKLQQKIDNELIHNFSIKLNNEDFDISKYAPGNKYWFYLVDKNTVSIIVYSHPTLIVSGNPVL